VRKAFNETTVRAALEPYANYLKLYDACKEFYESDSKKVATRVNSGVGKMKSIEDLLYVENVSMYELAFE
jgi:V-type H+-transporting ATPase subunit d